MIPFLKNSGRNTSVPICVCESYEHGGVHVRRPTEELALPTVVCLGVAEKRGKEWERKFRQTPSAA